MATLVNLTVPAKDIIGATFNTRRASVWIEANTPGSVIVVDGTTIRVGGRREQVGDDGTATITGLAATNTVDNPATGLEYRVTIVHTPKGSRNNEPERWISGWFPLTANRNLAAIPEAFDDIATPPTWRSAFRDEMEALRADAETARDEQVDLSNIDTTDDAVDALLKGTAGAGPKTRATLSATIAGAVAGKANTSDLPAAIDDRLASSPSVVAAAEAAAADAVPPAITADLATRPGLPTTTTDDTALVSIRDSTDHRTWLEATATTGGPTAYATTLMAAALGVTPAPASTTYYAVGDSMTGDAYGGGTSYPAKLAALLGKTVINAGVGGRRAGEIGMLAHGVHPLLTVTSKTIPSTTAAQACTVTWPDTGPGADRTFDIKVRGIPCTLTYTHATTSYTVARKTAGTAITLPTTVVAEPVTTAMLPGYVHIFWAGRNNVPKSTALPVVKEAGAEYRRKGIPFLMVNVCNSTAEPSGEANYVQIVDLNTSIRAEFPHEYVDMRGRMIAEGLALAGLTATGADTTAISEDRIPPQLLADGLHFNDAGRTACAAIIKDELTIRGLA